MTEPRETAECAKCHGSIPRGQGLTLAGRRLCAECSLKFSVAEPMSTHECPNCHRLVKGADWVFCVSGECVCPFCAGVPGPDSAEITLGEPRHGGITVLVVILGIVGGICILVALVYNQDRQADSLVAVGTLLSGILWFVLAAFLSLGRRILLCLEDLVKAPKPPKS